MHRLTSSMLPKKGYPTAHSTLASSREQTMSV